MNGYLFYLTVFTYFTCRYDFYLLAQIVPIIMNKLRYVHIFL